MWINSKFNVDKWITIVKNCVKIQKNVFLFKYLYLFIKIYKNSSVIMWITYAFKQKPPIYLLK